ncbi:MAG: Ig-like domain-containing protein [Bacilli bacterium]
MKKNLLVLIPALALLLGGCNKTPATSDSSETETSSEAVSVESVSINSTSVTLDIGQTYQLNAAVSPLTVSDLTIDWSSSDNDVATVNDSGRVTAVGAGTATVKAASHLDPTKYAECTVTVNAETVQLLMETPEIGKAFKLGTYQENLGTWIYADGTIDTGGPRLNTTENWSESIDVYFENSTTEGEYYLYHMVGDTKTYIGIVENDYHVNNLDNPYSWKWDDTYHTVYFTDASKGDMFLMSYNEFTTLSTSARSFANTSFVGRFYYRMDAVPATAVAVEPASVELYPTTSQQLTLKVTPVNGVYESVTWTSNNDKVTVSTTGLVTVAADADLNSTATITASVTVKGVDTPLTATATVTVKEKLNYGTLEAPLTVEEAITLIDKCGGTTPETMYITGIVSSNSAYGASYGNWSYINLTDSKYETEVAFQLYQPAAGEGTGFEETYAAANSLAGKKVVASGIGTYYAAKSLYETTGKGAAKLLSVEDGNVAPTAITLSVSELNLTTGTSSDPITVTYAPYGASRVAVTWTSSDEEVATVADGVVTAVKAGNATITASIEGLESQTVTVKVSDPIVDAKVATFNVTDYITANSITNGTQEKIIKVNDDVTLTASATDTNTGKFYSNGTAYEWRFYGSGNPSLIVSLSEGKTLYSVKIVYGTSNYADTTTEVSLTVDEENNTATFSSSTNFQIRSVEVTYK